jgi:hypothetical protein
MSRPAVLVPLAIVAAAGLAGCSIDVSLGPVDRGGTTTQERDVTAAVTAVELAASGSLTLAVGEPSLTVTAGRHVLDDLTTRVDGDTLVIDLDRHWLSPGPIAYDLRLPDLSSVRLSGSGEVTGEVAGTGPAELDLPGSGRIELDGLAADDLAVSVGGSGEVVVGDVAAQRTTVRIDGSGRVELDGETGRLDVAIPGSGAAELDGLAARDAGVDVSGSGLAEVDATQTLDASITGAGAITYRGDPTVTRSIAGSGAISAR